MIFLKKNISFSVRPLEEVEGDLHQVQRGLFSSSARKYTPVELEEISSEFLFTKLIEDLKKENLQFDSGTELPTFFKEIEIYFGKEALSSSNTIINLIHAEFKKRDIPRRVKKGVSPKRFALIIQ